jgi:hypothetical protein
VSLISLRLVVRENGLCLLVPRLLLVCVLVIVSGCRR